jgi:hypothetical protein
MTQPSLSKHHIVLPLKQTQPSLHGGNSHEHFPVIFLNKMLITAIPSPTSNNMPIICSIVIHWFWLAYLTQKMKHSLISLEMCSCITRVVLVLGFLLGLSRIIWAFFLALAMAGESPWTSSPLSKSLLASVSFSSSTSMTLALRGLGACCLGGMMGLELVGFQWSCYSLMCCQTSPSNHLHLERPTLKFSHTRTFLQIFDKDKKLYKTNKSRNEQKIMWEVLPCLVFFPPLGVHVDSSLVPIPISTSLLPHQLLPCSQISPQLVPLVLKLSFFQHDTEKTFHSPRYSPHCSNECLVDFLF